MSSIGHNSVAGKMLKSVIERVELLEEDKRGISEDIKEIYAEAKGNGLDPKIIRMIIRERKMNSTDRAEMEALLDTYKAALGMLADTPLGKAALDNIND